MTPNYMHKCLHYYCFMFVLLLGIFLPIENVYAQCECSGANSDKTPPMLKGLPEQSIITVKCHEIPPLPDVMSWDNCDGDFLKIHFEEKKTGQKCTYLITRKWWTKDRCGNKSDFTQRIQIADTQAPILTGVPPDISVQCDAIPEKANVTITDDCDDAVQIHFKESIPNPGHAPYTIIREWSARDDCGNKVIKKQKITVLDTTEPVLQGLPTQSAIHVGCGQVPPVPTVTAMDNCDGGLPVEFTEKQHGEGCSAKIIRRWQAVDACDNYTIFTQTIWINDQEAPSLLGLPDDLTTSCNNIPEPPTITARDDCSGEVTVSFSEVEQYNYTTEQYDIIRTWMATDDCNNKTTATQTITIGDSEAPVLLGLPAAQSTAECGKGNGNGFPTAPPVTASDNCDGMVTVQFAQENNDNEPCSIIRTWTATDEAGNESTFTQTIALNDEEPPTLTGIPSDLTIGCRDTHPSVPKTIKATDDCDEEVDVHFTEMIQQMGQCPYYLVRTWTAKDNCGNQATASQTITVIDEEKPTLVGLPKDKNVWVKCGEIPAVPTVGVVDACDKDIRVQFTETKVGLNNSDCTYNLRRTWSATDNCGNKTEFTQVIDVTDNMPPDLLGLPTDQSEVLSCSSVPRPPDVIARDECSGEAPVHFSEKQEGEGCSFSVVRTWSATDDCGNTASFTQTIQVNADEAPVLNGLPSEASLWVKCGEVPLIQEVVTASDNCNNALEVQFEEVEVGPPCNFSIQRTWSIADACGHTNSFTQLIDVMDEMPPVLQGLPDAPNLWIKCDEPIPAVANVTAYDTCDGEIAVKFVEIKFEENNNPCVYNLHRTWTATDACGNESTFTQVIDVMDEMPPELIGLPTAQMTTLSCDNLPAVPNVIARDNCNGEVPVHFSEVQEGEDCNFTVKRNWSATDACGNTANYTQTIFVNGATPPVLTGLPEAALWLKCGELPIAQETVTAFNNCNVALNVQFQETQIGPPCNYSLERTWSVASACGGTGASSFTQVIDIMDVMPPVFFGLPPENFTAECGEIPPVPTVTAIDNCQGTEANVLFSEAQISETTMIRAWGAIDACGNEAFFAQTITLCNTSKTNTLAAQDVEADKLEIIELTAFPNPAKDYVQASYQLTTDSGDAQLLLYDVSGKQLKVKKLLAMDGQQQIRFDLSNLNTGMYLLVLKTKETQHTQKFMKL